MPKLAATAATSAAVIRSSKMRIGPFPRQAVWAGESAECVAAINGLLAKRKGTGFLGKPSMSRAPRPCPGHHLLGLEPAACDHSYDCGDEEDTQQCSGRARTDRIGHELHPILPACDCSPVGASREGPDQCCRLRDEQLRP